MTDDERKELSLKAGRFMLSVGIPFWVDETTYDVIRKGMVGFAQYYLQHCCDESGSRNTAKIEIYKKLLEFDSQLGTTQSEQLSKYVPFSTRMDLIKVRVIFRFFGIHIILDH